ncbi:MAG: hypothetical protein ACJ78Z_14290 [Myxococcales bacterium]
MQGDSEVQAAYLGGHAA